MLSWFKRKPAMVTPPPPMSQAINAIESKVPIAAQPLPEATPAPVVPDVVPKTSKTSSKPALRIAVRMAGHVKLPKTYAQPRPQSGLTGIEVAAPRVRQASVARVQACGRRLIVEVGSPARSYAYALQKDGAYRLESHGASRTPRLILGVEAN